MSRIKKKGDLDWRQVTAVMADGRGAGRPLDRFVDLWAQADQHKVHGRLGGRECPGSRLSALARCARAVHV